MKKTDLIREINQSYIAIYTCCIEARKDSYEYRNSLDMRVGMPNELYDGKTRALRIALYILELRFGSILDSDLYMTEYDLGRLEKQLYRTIEPAAA